MGKPSGPDGCVNNGCPPQSSMYSASQCKPHFFLLPCPWNVMLCEKTIALLCWLATHQYFSALGRWQLVSCSLDTATPDNLGFSESWRPQTRQNSRNQIITLVLFLVWMWHGVFSILLNLFFPPVMRWLITLGATRVFLVHSNYHSQPGNYFGIWNYFFFSGNFY